MSDPQQPVGEPVEDPRGDVDDVVGSAHEGLANAAAAGEGAVSGKPAPSEERESAPEEEPEPTAAAEPAATPEPAETPEPAAPTADAPAQASAAPAHIAPVPDPSEPEPDPWDSPEATALQYTPAEYASAETVAVTAGATPSVTPSEPAPDEETTVIAPAAVAPAAMSPAVHPIFVQAPEAPHPRGNRAAAGAIGLVAAICFGILYLSVWLVNELVSGKVSTAEIGTWLGHAAMTWALWVPIVVFFIAFWLLGAIINRGRWGAWVIFGLLVGFAAWGGYLLGQLGDAPFWLLSPSEGQKIVQEHMFTPVAIGAFIIGRELTIWFGAWAAKRGRRMTALNLEAQREYEHTLEAGPQLHVP